MVLKVPVRPDAAYMMQDFYFETIARLQKSSGINDPIVNLLDQHKNYIDFFPYTEYSRLSYGEEVRFSNLGIQEIIMVLDNCCRCDQ